MLVACNTTDTTETEAATDAEQIQNTVAVPVDVVDEEAKRLKQESPDINTEGDAFTAENNNVEDFEENQ